MLLDPKFTQALRKRTAALAVLCEVDHPDGPVYLWSGVGKLAWDGHVWIGAGVLGAITTAARTTELRIDDVRLSLSAVDTHALSEVSMDIRNRQARTWLAAIGPDYRVIGTPLPLDEILLDYATESIAENGLATLTLVGQAGFWTLERATEEAWSREDAIFQWGTDTSGEPIETGFDFITSLRMKDTKWTPPAS